MRRILRVIPALIAASLLSAATTCAPAPPPELPDLPSAPAGSVSYQDDVQPVLDRRCVVCHGCYDSPCQLQLSSREGFDRGASKDAIYHSDRLKEVDPSRLFIDARTTEAWRARGFHSVLDRTTELQERSLLESMLALGRARPSAAGERLPDDFPLDITRELTCSTPDEFAKYADDQPLGGMPYGTAPLSSDELAVLAAWADAPTPIAAHPPLPEGARQEVDEWEAFLNGPTLKDRVIARYLYEHWFLAHLYFEDLGAGPFFRIVRSKTPPGSPVDEIASRRPYDDPGVAAFSYRLVPIRKSIVHKTHIVYSLDDERMRRLSELFLGDDWTPTRTPAYGLSASNPFVTFDEIPARARYQFLLDDAQYFVMTFIRGPVCRGQTAVDVIEDRFYITFLDPDHDLSVTDPTYLELSKPYLSMPAEHGSDFELGGLWLEYQREQRKYLDIREELYAVALPDGRGATLDFIWDGDGTNENALLTVFRHFDNATVVRGFLGATPKTAWVLDFPLFERIYYDLVANFDVFGSVTHQLSTRLYMDHLRMQAENLFLAFLPDDVREQVRASWYVGATRQLNYFVNAIRSSAHGAEIAYRGSDPKAELLEMIVNRNPAVSGPDDDLNRCSQSPCDRDGASAVEQRADRALRALAGMTGGWVASLPELTFLRVRAPGAGGSAVYTLVHDRAHTNVASMFGEEDRLVPEDDTLTIAPGYLGSYPNFAFDVPVDEIEAFAQALTAGRDDADVRTLVERWGVRRTSAAFWETMDWFHADFRQRHPTEAGLFDLNRYENL